MSIISVGYQDRFVTYCSVLEIRFCHLQIIFSDFSFSAKIPIIFSPYHHFYQYHINTQYIYFISNSFYLLTYYLNNILYLTSSYYLFYFSHTSHLYKIIIFSNFQTYFFFLQLIHIFFQFLFINVYFYSI